MKLKDKLEQKQAQIQSEEGTMEQNKLEELEEKIAIKKRELELANLDKQLAGDASLQKTPDISGLTFNELREKVKSENCTVAEIDAMDELSETILRTEAKLAGFVSAEDYQSAIAKLHNAQDRLDAQEADLDQKEANLAEREADVDYKLAKLQQFNDGLQELGYYEQHNPAVTPQGLANPDFKYPRWFNEARDRLLTLLEETFAEPEEETEGLGFPEEVEEEDS